MMHNVTYPVLCFWKNFIRIEPDERSLTTTTKAGLKNGMFIGLTIIDSDGNGFVVRNAIKICGIGFFWGYNIFLNQKIKVELLIEKELQQIPLEEVKAKVNNSFSKWHGWKTGDNLKELKEKISKASSIKSMIDILTEEGV